MVLPFTLGFFSPLPLAMMIPFMATQSLAMGEAFGKSFQYGKRKISSMTNEEFNRYTFNDMMDEQTANVKSIIPKLHEQMEDSKQMQADIFAEMIQLVPTIFDALFKALGLDKSAENTRGGGNELPFGGITIPPPAITQATAETPPAELTLLSHDGSTLSPPSPPTPEKSNYAKALSDWNINTILSYQRMQEYQLLNAQQKSLVQKRLTTLGHKIESTSTPPPAQTPLTLQEEAQKTYLTTTINHQKVILEKKGAYIKANNDLQATGGARNNASIRNAQNLADRTHNAWKDAEKLLINYILISRNNLVLKSVANRDWNDRIWQM